MRTEMYARNPGARNNFWNSLICPTVCSLGPLSAIITDPIIHSAQPSQPKKLSFSFRKKDERIAQMTTESAPSGVLNGKKVRCGQK
jgi:hypothetical protein